MIQQIVSHTPLYVWALLAFLLYRGALATREREVAFSKLFIIPVVMLVLSLSGLNSHGALGQGVWAVWLLAMLGGAALTWAVSSNFSRNAIAVDRAAGTVRQRGSWTPLLLMIAIFCTKYSVAVYSAMHPEAIQQTTFALTVTTAYGVFNGIFAGRLLRYVTAYFSNPQARGQTPYGV